MNIELEEVAVQDVSDDALALAASGGTLMHKSAGSTFKLTVLLSYCWQQTHTRPMPAWVLATFGWLFKGRL